MIEQGTHHADRSDPLGSALNRSQQRARENLPRLFGVVGLARDTLHREAPELARAADMIVIDGPPRVAGLMRSALLAADLVLIPVQPSPFDGWTLAEMLSLLREARIYRPQLAARFVLNRCGARTVIARETTETLADHDPPVLASSIGQRVAFANAAQSGRPGLRACRAPRRRSRDCGARRRGREDPAMSGHSPRRGFASRPGDVESGIYAPEAHARRADGASAFTAGLTIDVTPTLRGRIKVAAFRRRVAVADRLRDLLACEFPADPRAHS